MGADLNSAFIAQLATATVGLLHVLMACAAWLMLRGPRQVQAVQLWAAGTLALGCALALGGLAHPLPPQLPDSVRHVWLPALLLASMALVPRYGLWGSVYADMVFKSVSAAVLFAIGAWWFVRERRSVAR
jgi:hypothetical protein